jgi:hypothetical protein
MFTLLEFCGAYVAALAGVKAHNVAHSAIARKTILKASDCMAAPLCPENLGD